MVRRYDLVVFDWDGTLADSAGFIAHCIQRACADLGLAIPTGTQARHVIGLGLAEALQHIAPELPPSRHAELAGRYRLHYLAGDAEIPLFTGARELLVELRERGHALAVATGKSRRGLDRALRQLGVADLFDATRCADESASKPDPAMLFELFEQLGHGPGRSLMIGDTSHDLAMARRAGADALAVAYGAHPKHELLAARPLACVEAFDELGAWLRAHG